ncbi:hypothetical protein A0H81_13567 [Grifola frondosa]|uniref:Clock-controlled protein 8 n=1 Tax=Grifola frondosa TaxID=5627 RepID=A0A1C7LNR2_GRIFR|nr:hypothetical protein A0H81_13567 [Grifola frondosa]
MALTDQDESVRIAVRALGDMRNSALASPSTSFQPTPALSVTSSTSSPSLPSPSITGEESLADEEQERQQRTEPRENEDTRFVSRVSNIPIVNSALRAYEHSKASSRVVKYGAEMMESSVKSISRPVIERLPVGQIDEFACRQLDKLGNYARRASSTDRGRSTSVEADRPVAGHAARSRGIGAAVSEESMRRLKYCLQWLQYATAHLDAQILVLRNFIASLQPSGSPLGLSSGAPRSPPITPHHLRTLQAAKRDVVETLRQVVDVVSRYAGGALPEPARSRLWAGRTRSITPFAACIPRDIADFFSRSHPRTFEAV